MARPDVFALANTGLDRFLRAEVGTELNGSTLTMLSLLARLGFDPWVEAAGWALLPRTATVDRLAGLIVQMPLSPESLGDARSTATRLIRLLPGQPKPPAAERRNSPLPVIALVAGICLGLAVAFVMKNYSHDELATTASHQQTEPAKQ